MKGRQLAVWQHAVLVCALTFLACSPGKQAPGQQVKTGSQTNWLKSCAGSSECGELACICGVCSQQCEVDDQCEGLAGASCVADSDPGAVALCSGQTPSSSLCLPLCGDQTCDTDEACVAGVCVPAREANATVSVDPSVRHQKLLGFGASLAYAEDEIVNHPEKAALFDLMFSESGFDVFRMRDRYEGDNESDLEAASEIFAAAEERIGRRPTIFMTSGSPPAELKANNTRTCAGDPETCTLVQTTNGDFDYQGFADHWRASLEAHAAVDILPDYLSIQNDPNWVPDATSPADACRFLPEEGTTSVMIDGASVDVSYPGYQQALTAVNTAIADLPNAPSMVAPEVTSIGAVQDYAMGLDPTTYDVLAFHLYGSTDQESIDLQPFEQVRQLAEQASLPVFQSEMLADGPNTALLAHYSLVLADAAVYLQNDFAAAGSNDSTLIALSDDSFVAQGPYHALRHYARYTDPEWTRVDAMTESSEVFSSAWLSPDEQALTIVLVNPGSTEIAVELDFPQSLGLSSSLVERTVFDGTERSAQLGAIPSDNIVRLPGNSIVTVALSSDSP